MGARSLEGVRGGEGGEQAFGAGGVGVETQHIADEARVQHGGCKGLRERPDRRQGPLDGLQFRIGEAERTQAVMIEPGGTDQGPAAQHPALRGPGVPAPGCDGGVQGRVKAVRGVAVCGLDRLDRRQTAEAEAQSRLGIRRHQGNQGLTTAGTSGGGPGLVQRGSGEARQPLFGQDGQPGREGSLHAVGDVGPGCTVVKGGGHLAGGQGCRRGDDPVQGDHVPGLLDPASGGEKALEDAVQPEADRATGMAAAGCGAVGAKSRGDLDFKCHGPQPGEGLQCSHGVAPEGAKGRP